MPVAFLDLCQDPATLANNPGMVQAFHCMALYFPQLGQVTQWDNMVFAFVGDPVLQQIQSVLVVLGNVFNWAAAFAVPTMAAAQAAFMADLALQLLGLYQNNDPDTILYHPH